VLPQDQLVGKYRSLATPVLGSVATEALEQRILALGGERPAANLSRLAIKT